MGSAVSHETPLTTLLIVPIDGDTIQVVREDIAKAIDRGADAIELRVDRMPDVPHEHLAGLLEHPVGDVPMLLAIRSTQEGGDWTGSEPQRVECLAELGSPARYVDVEFATWRRSTTLRDALRLVTETTDDQHAAAETSLGTDRDRVLILSKHDFAGRPTSLHGDLVEMLSAGDRNVPKLAWRARTVRDNFEAFELMRSSPRPLIAICMGPDGMASRVLAKKFGAFATFAALELGRESAPGQVTIDVLRGTYRWDAIDVKTHVYGVLGDPVGHSLSPGVHNAAFREADVNAVYLPLRVGETYEAFKAFMVEVQARRWLDFRGFSVTLPHKAHALRFIKDTGGTLTQDAHHVGAVNTMRLEPDGSWSGANTDLPAAMETISIGLAEGRAEAEAFDAAVLGAGGVARAVVAGLSDRGASVTIYNRTPAKAKALAEQFGCRHAPWEERANGRQALIVNCTSVGLAPDIDASPMPAGNLGAAQFVFDTIYNPLCTRLLQQAREAGCGTMGGAEMFARQAAAQFEYWTNRRMSVRFYRQATLSALRGC